jgi:hypothetical protein
MNDDGYRAQLELLKVEHRDLDDAIAALRQLGSVDQLQIARLKKKKLVLKDQIMRHHRLGRSLKPPTPFQSDTVPQFPVETR